MDHPAIKNAEPIPGYRLIERLGRGGYGEVWKVEAPGGMHKAIKFVHGDLEGAGDDGKAAEQEFKSLNRVKSIRHPFLLSLERFDIIDGRLVIVMELADRNLWDRFVECVEAKLPGIPRAELISYMEEAAEALDLMNLQHQIQHLDVKPQNIFLVHRHVKVADFGLAKDLEGARGKLTGGLTPMYAPPETFEEWVSRQSDQYSLAIVYMEMLTGRRPFNGTTTRQLVLQHLTGTPELSALPSPDREAVARALAKKPEDRFTTCMEFIQAVKGELPVATRPSSLPSAEPVRIEDDTASLTNTATRPIARARPSSLPALVTPRSKGSTIGPKAARTPVAGAAATPRPAAPVEQTGDGVLFPAVVIGVGATGLRVLSNLRRLIYERFGRSTLPHLRWLFVDTDQEAIHVAQNLGKAIAFSPEEVLWARLHRPTHYMSREGLPPIESWLSAEDLYRMPRAPATDGMRGIGRLALLDHFHVISHRLRKLLEPFVSAAAVEESDRLTGLGIRSTFPRVFITNSLGGATGAGMFIDLAYLVRRELKRLEFGSPQVVGLFGLPRPGDHRPGRLALANARAALIELQHFSRPKARYETQFDTREKAVQDNDRPFVRCAIVRPTETEKPETRDGDVATLAHIAMTELLTPIGRAAHPDGSPPADRPITEVGIRRVTWPRAEVLRAASWALCRLMLNQWLDKEGRPVDHNLLEFVSTQWTERKLDRINLRSQLETRLITAQGRPPQDRIGFMLEALTGPQSPEQPYELVLRSVFRQLLDYIGMPGSEEREVRSVVGNILVDWVRDASAQADAKLISMAVSFVEQPGLRLAGAEEVARVLQGQILEELRLAEREASGIEEESRVLFIPIAQTMSADVDSRNGTPPAPEARSMLGQWAAARLHGMVARACARFYRIVFDNAPEMARELNLVRTQLSAFLKQILDMPPPELQTDGVTTAVFPDGVTNIADSAKQLLCELAPADLREFDNVLQARTRHQFRSLAEVCTRAKDFGAAFLPMAHEQAVQFLAKRAPRLTAVDILSAQSAGREQLVSRVSEIMTAAAPEGLMDAPTAMTVLGVPPGGETIVDIARRLSSHTPVHVSHNPDDIVVWREAEGLTLDSFALLRAEQIPAASTDGKSPPSPHSRNDIRWDGDY
jgi:serine/threonine protein kinase